MLSNYVHVVDLSSFVFRSARMRAHRLCIYLALSAAHVVLGIETIKSKWQTIQKVWNLHLLWLLSSCGKMFFSNLATILFYKGNGL